MKSTGEIGMKITAAKRVKRQEEEQKRTGSPSPDRSASDPSGRDQSDKGKIEEVAGGINAARTGEAGDFAVGGAGEG